MASSECASRAGGMCASMWSTTSHSAGAGSGARCTTSVANLPAHWRSGSCATSNGGLELTIMAAQSPKWIDDGWKAWGRLFDALGLQPGHLRPSLHRGDGVRGEPCRLPEDTVGTYGLIVLLARLASDLSKPADRLQAEGLLGAILSMPFGEASWALCVALDANVQCTPGADIVGHDAVELCCIGPMVSLDRLAGHASPLAQRLMRVVGNAQNMLRADLCMLCIGERSLHWLLQQLVWWAGWFIEYSSNFLGTLTQDSRLGPGLGTKRRADIALGETLVERSSGSRTTQARNDATDRGLSLSWDLSVSKLLLKYYHAMRMSFDSALAISVALDGARCGGRSVVKMVLASTNNVAAIAPPMASLGGGRTIGPLYICNTGKKPECRWTHVSCPPRLALTRHWSLFFRFGW